MRRLGILAVLPLVAAGCFHDRKPEPEPGQATPKQIIARQADRIERLRGQLAERDAQVKHLQKQLAVAQGLQEFGDLAVQVNKVVLGRYSHVKDFDEARPGPDGVKVYLYVYDRKNEKIKRAGRIELKVFDLKAERKLGHWIFDPRRAMDHWKSGWPLNCYVFELPWQEDPGDVDQVDLFWQFDALTGQSFTGRQTLGFTTRKTP